MHMTQRNACVFGRSWRLDPRPIQSNLNRHTLTQSPMMRSTLHLWAKHDNTSLLDCARLPVDEMCHDEWKETIHWFHPYHLSSTIEFWSIHHRHLKSTIDALLQESITSKSLPQCARCMQLMDGHLERIASFWTCLLSSVVKPIQPQVTRLVEQENVGEETDEYLSSGDESFDDPAETTRVSSDASRKSSSSLSKYIDSSSGSDDDEETIQLRSVATVLSSLDASASHPLLSNKTNQSIRLPPSLLIKKGHRSLLRATKKRKESSDSNDSSDDYMEVSSSYPNKKSNVVDTIIVPVPTTKVALRSGGRASSTLVGVVRKSESKEHSFVVTFKKAPTYELSLRDVVGQDKLVFFSNLEKVGQLTYYFTLTEAGLNHYECRAYALTAIGEIITIKC